LIIYSQLSLLRSYTLQNYGIIVAFGIGFFVLLLIAAEYNTNSAFDTAMTLFKQGTHAVEVIATPEDEEKSSKLSIHPPSLDARTPRTAGAPAPSLEKPATNDVFTWQHLQYIVPVSGGERRLLDDVSGYVAPGKLTALMGESGAGKVRRIFMSRTLRSTFYHRRRCSMFWLNGSMSELSWEIGSLVDSPFPRTSRPRRE
jgi:ABC-type transport system involved in cytochrome bd biosynthesis fused ATPase/permease subunit